MKCAVIILTFLHINTLSSGLQKEDAATSRGKRTVFHRKKSPLVSTQPSYDFNLLPKYYSVPIIQPYNDPEVNLVHRSNSRPALEPPSIIYTEQFDSSKSPINLPPRYINTNEYYVEKYAPDVLTVLSELMKALMVNNGRRMQIKKPAYEKEVYYKRKNVMETPRFEIMDQNITSDDVLYTERSDTDKESSTTTVKYTNNNSTQLKPTTESTTDLNSESTTELSTELTTELTTESTNTTISHIDEDKPDKDLLDVNAEDADNDNETGELSSANETLSVNETKTDEGRPDEEVNDLNNANKTSEAGEQKDDIFKKSNQFRETVKSEVAKELEFIIELLTFNKLPNTNITEKKSEDIKEKGKSSKNNTNNVKHQKNKAEKFYDKEKSKSIFTNFEGNEHFINFFLFHPNNDFFNLKPFDRFEKTKSSDEKLKSDAEKISGSKGIDNTNKETNKLKASVDNKNDSDSKTAEGIENDSKQAASSLEADVSNSDINTAATDV